MREAGRAAGRPRFVCAGRRLPGRGACPKRGRERAEGRGTAEEAAEGRLRLGAAVAACRSAGTSCRA